MVPPLFIRADASVAIGTGHVMRMIALGQAWQDLGGEVHFLSAEITPALEQRLKEETFNLSHIEARSGSEEDLKQSLRVIRGARKSGDFTARVALDGYHFDSAYQLEIKEAGMLLLVMDDFGHADYYHADWVLNQNISAREDLYSNRSQSTELLLGTKYALLRREFLNHRGRAREIPDVARRVLVTLGGSDPGNVTLKVLNAIIHLDLHIKVVIGGSNPHLPEIRNFLASEDDSRALVEIIVDAKDMPELMSWAEVGIAAAGSTVLELAFMGLPCLLLTLAENQLQIARAIRRTNFATCHEMELSFNPTLFIKEIKSLLFKKNTRIQYISKETSIVDGRGSKKIASTLIRAAQNENLHTHRQSR